MQSFCSDNLLGCNYFAIFIAFSILFLVKGFSKLGVHSTNLFYMLVQTFTLKLWFTYFATTLDFLFHVSKIYNQSIIDVKNTITYINMLHIQLLIHLTYTYIHILNRRDYISCNNFFIIEGIVA